MGVNWKYELSVWQMIGKLSIIQSAEKFNHNHGSNEIRQFPSVMECVRRNSTNSNKPATILLLFPFHALLILL